MLCLQRTQRQAGGCAENFPLLCKAPVILGTKASTTSLIQGMSLWRNCMHRILQSGLDFMFSQP